MLDKQFYLRGQHMRRKRRRNIRCANDSNHVIYTLDAKIVRRKCLENRKTFPSEKFVSPAELRVNKIQAFPDTPKVNTQCNFWTGVIAWTRK